MLTPILDFALVHADLERTRTCGDVKRAIGRALRVHSCVVDLHEADQCRLAMQQKLDAQAEAGRDDVTEAALLATAVQLYARATSTSLKNDGDRKSFRIEDALKRKPEQLSDHKLLLVLRSRVFAHVYENEEVAGQAWNRASVFFFLHEGLWRIGSATNRVKFDWEPLDRLGRQLPVAMEILMNRAEIAQERLARSIEQSKDDASLQQALASARVDPRDFFGSEEQARASISASLANPSALTSFKPG